MTNGATEVPRNCTIRISESYEGEGFIAVALEVARVLYVWWDGRRGVFGSGEGY
ncbi:MAG: hypothetical protein WC993_11595 [Methanoculleus sp.]|jgi:hypothetical protein|nr:hypothetical protein [Methanomicrobiales archaeon]